MRAPILLYTIAIMIMMWRATALVADQQRPTRYDWCAILGAVSFGFSDTLIALDRFHAALSGVRVPIILTYWVGQGLIAASALRPAPALDQEASASE